MRDQLFIKLAFLLSLLRSAVYAMEYNVLYGVNKMLFLFVETPKEKYDKKIKKIMQTKVFDLFRVDATNMLKGYYSKKAVFSFDVVKQLLVFPQVLLDSIKISRRRKLNVIKELSVSNEVPDYIKRNFHFQTDGYFSTDSAKMYELQVEILFNGTAQAMRRMLVAHLKSRYPEKKFFKILEVAAGVGSASVVFSKSFEFDRFVVSDISEFYIEEARKNLNDPRLEFVVGKAEDMPFEDGEFDLIFSVFLFHEIPRTIRGEVIKEGQRLLKNGGVFAFCDSIQKDDDSRINVILETFPKNYHEPFYKDYTLWSAEEDFKANGFSDVESETHLLSKYWSAVKK